VAQEGQGVDGRGTSPWLWGWLDQIAGRRVKTLPLFLAWVGLVGLACGVAYLLGAQSDGPYYFVAAAVSAPYWFWGVPRYLRRGQPD
jgi:hypothetical protein